MNKVLHLIKKSTASVAIMCTAEIVIKKATKRKQRKAREKKRHVPYGPYEAFFKRPLDVIVSVTAIILLSPVLMITAILVRAKLGSPVLFIQARPGKIDSRTGKEKIFKLYKFRTMTDARDEKGELLPDDMRLTGFGALLRSASIDELPELVNILKGEMSVIGPRPQLVHDMVFMTKEQRLRHVIRPGLTGLAQVNGRNRIDWNKRFAYDLRYVGHITFAGDVRIFLQTIRAALLQHDGIAEEGMATSMELGDWLLKEGIISKQKYESGRKRAEKLKGTM